MLGLDEVKQLVVEGEDVAADLRGVELAVLAGQGCLDLLADVRAGHDALIRGLRGVVFLGHLRADAGLGDQLLLRGEEVDLQPDQCVDLVEQREFAAVS